MMPLAIAVGSFWFPVPGWLRVVSWALVVTGAITLFELWIAIQYHKSRIVPQAPESAA
jgi:hypothetical protein